MEVTKYEQLMEKAAVAGLEKVIIPFVEGKTKGDKIDRQKLSASMQTATTFARIMQSREHRRGLNLVAIKMMTGEDREAAKAMIQKHFDKTLELPEPKK